MKLRVWRAREGLSLMRLAERIGCSHVTVSRIERGKNHPDRETIQAIYDATKGEVTLLDWFTEDGHPIPQAASSLSSAAQ